MKKTRTDDSLKIQSISTQHSNIAIHLEVTIKGHGALNHQGEWACGLWYSRKRLRTPCDWVASRYDFHKKVLQCNAKVSSCFYAWNNWLAHQHCALILIVVLIDKHQVTLLFGRVVVVGGQPTNEPIYE